MLASEKLSTLVSSLVIPDRPSSAKEVESEATTKTLTAILDGGSENIVGLVDLLVESGKGDDSKVRYAIHALAVRVCAARDEKQRQMLTTALASTLNSQRPREALGFVVRQLQVCGGAEVVPALGKALADEELCEAATQALLAIKVGAADQFRKALPDAKGKSRLPIIQALGTLRDAKAAPTLRKIAEEKDADVRLTALWALANMGDAEAVPLLLAATAVEGYERTKAASMCLLLAERLRESGKKADAEKVYKHLSEKFTGDNERHIREAATNGLNASKG